jgi:hypothetical protein
VRRRPRHRDFGFTNLVFPNHRDLFDADPHDIADGPAAESLVRHDQAQGTAGQGRSIHLIRDCFPANCGAISPSATKALYPSAPVGAPFSSACGIDDACGGCGT